ncbi:hypothetical protein CEXT_552301 [Caerostris extrusa]|uniref:Uncharacterized protein n=1 Tax=Caerostris extrusa TaxID=172846 RepID=A0AAV4U7S7_CAEEX|nr:hypothetical protein CEXT_552301 [Caerostris extrusa]
MIKVRRFTFKKTSHTSELIPHNPPSPKAIHGFYISKGHPFYIRPGIIGLPVTTTAICRMSLFRSKPQDISVNNSTVGVTSVLPFVTAETCNHSRVE